MVSLEPIPDQGVSDVSSVAYEPPRLTVYGDIRVLTRATGNQLPSDMPSFSSPA